MWCSNPSCDRRATEGSSLCYKHLRMSGGSAPAVAPPPALDEKTPEESFQAKLAEQFSSLFPDEQERASLPSLSTCLNEPEHMPGELPRFGRRSLSSRGSAASSTASEYRRAGERGVDATRSNLNQRSTELVPRINASNIDQFRKQLKQKNAAKQSLEKAPCYSRLHDLPQGAKHAPTAAVPKPKEKRKWTEGFGRELAARMGHDTADWGREDSEEERMLQLYGAPPQEAASLGGSQGGEEGGPLQLGSKRGAQSEEKERLALNGTPSEGKEGLEIATLGGKQKGRVKHAISTTTTGLGVAPPSSNAKDQAEVEAGASFDLFMASVELQRFHRLNPLPGVTRGSFY